MIDPLSLDFKTLRKDDGKALVGFYLKMQDSASRYVYPHSIRV